MDYTEYNNTEITDETEISEVFNIHSVSTGEQVERSLLIRKN